MGFFGKIKNFFRKNVKKAVTNVWDNVKKIPGKIGEGVAGVGNIVKKGAEGVNWIADKAEGVGNVVSKIPIVGDRAKAVWEKAGGSQLWNEGRGAIDAVKGVGNTMQVAGGLIKKPTFEGVGNLIDSVKNTALTNPNVSSWLGGMKIPMHAKKIAQQMPMQGKKIAPQMPSIGAGTIAPVIPMVSPDSVKMPIRYSPPRFKPAVYY